MVCSTERLEIRKMKEENWRDLLEMCRDFEASPYVNYDYPMPTEEEPARERAKQWEKSGRFYAVYLRGTTEMIGYICFHDDNDAQDIGYTFKAKYQKQGYAYEAASAMIRYMRENGVTRFTAGLALKNIPSKKLAEKLGFVLIDTKIRAFRKDAQGRDIQFECGEFELVL